MATLVCGKTHAGVFGEAVSARSDDERTLRGPRRSYSGTQLQKIHKAADNTRLRSNFLSCIPLWLGQVGKLISQPLGKSDIF